MSLALTTGSTFLVLAVSLHAQARVAVPAGDPGRLRSTGCEPGWLPEFGDRPGTSRAGAVDASARTDGAALRTRIVALAQRHRRYGVGMIHLKLRQAGEIVNYKRVERLYRRLRGRYVHR